LSQGNGGRCVILESPGERDVRIALGHDYRTRLRRRDSDVQFAL
jgi:hypothetical protein